MAFPQGIDFRSTSAYVTDPTDHTYEISTTANYPRTSAQGNTVGWETITGTLNGRDRSTSVDARIAGLIFNSSTTGNMTYRIDLPSSGSYLIKGAAHDAITGVKDTKLEVSDTTTLLVTAWDQASMVFLEPVDITNVKMAASSWPSGQGSRTLTWSTTIARFKLTQPTSGGTQNFPFISNIYIESAGETFIPRVLFMGGANT